jgi:Lrp/AsnC family transcriptional regulator, leucine-responsive regulatory protein
VDGIDRKLLRLVQDKGRIPVSELAEEIGLSEAPSWRRLRRLEEGGWVSGYHAHLDRKRLGYTVFAFVSVRFSIHHLDMDATFTSTMLALPSVLSCHNVTGDVDYILTVVAQDLDEYEQFTRTLRSIPGVTAIQTHLSLKEIKSTTSIDIPVGLTDR